MPCYWPRTHCGNRELLQGRLVTVGLSTRQRKLAGGGGGREEPQSFGQDFKGCSTLDAGEAGISNGGLGRPEQGPQAFIPW